MPTSSPTPKDTPRCCATWWAIPTRSASAFARRFWPPPPPTSKPSPMRWSKWPIGVWWWCLARSRRSRRRMWLSRVGWMCRRCCKARTKNREQRTNDGMRLFFALCSLFSRGRSSMPFTKILRLGLIHVAVAITLVPINSTLNRIMISELKLAATLVAVMASLPYLFSPLQVWIGGYSDRHPLWGYRRTPYIALGLLLCVGGAALAPTAAFTLHDNFGNGLLVALLAFGAWGMGFNFATVSYLSLATDLAGEEHRARTVGVMWFMLIVSVIVTAILAARARRPYSVEALYRVFYVTSGVALTLGVLGLLGLERRGALARTGERRSFREMLRLIGANSQARHFFVHLVVL